MTHLWDMTASRKAVALCGAKERWPLVSTAAFEAHVRGRGAAICGECRAIWLGAFEQLELCF